MIEPITGILNLSLSFRRDQLMFRSNLGDLLTISN